MALAWEARREREYIDRLSLSVYEWTVILSIGLNGIGNHFHITQVSFSQWMPPFILTFVLNFDEGVLAIGDSWSHAWTAKPVLVGLDKAAKES